MSQELLAEKSPFLPKLLLVMVFYHSVRNPQIPTNCGDWLHSILLSSFSGTEISKKELHTIVCCEQRLEGNMYGLILVNGRKPKLIVLIR